MKRNDKIAIYLVALAVCILFSLLVFSRKEALGLRKYKSDMSKCQICSVKVSGKLQNEGGFNTYPEITKDSYAFRYKQPRPFLDILAGARGD